MQQTRSIALTIALILFAVTNLFAQAPKNCNLGIRLTSPVEGAAYDFGDTVAISIMIKNNGPDDITLDDTVYYYFIFSEGYAPLSIPSGDSVPVENIGGIFNSDTSDVPATVCIQLANISSTYSDPDSTNDKSCVTFILKGSNSTGIVQTQNPSAKPLKIFPNPAHAEIQIQMEPGRKQNSISIKDPLGSTLFQQDYGKASVPTTLKLDISGYRPGLYFVELDADGEKHIAKLVIQ